MAKSGEKKSENPYLQRENVQILRVKGEIRGLSDEKKNFSCRVTHPDVEASGMTVFVDCGKYDFTPGEWVQFTFNVPKTFNLGGRVIWVQPVARNNRIIRENAVYSIRVGIEFDRAKEEDQLHIANFLAYLENPFFIVSESDASASMGSDQDESSEGDPEEQLSEDQQSEDRNSDSESLDEGDLGAQGIDESPEEAA